MNENNPAWMAFVRPEAWVIMSKKTHGLSLTPFEKALNRFPISKLVSCGEPEGRPI